MELLASRKMIVDGRFRKIHIIYIDIGIYIWNGTPLQYSCLENPTDRGAWWAAVHGVAGSRTGLSDFTFTFHFHALEKEMATHSSALAWKIPWTEGNCRLLSMGSQSRTGLSDFLFTFYFHALEKGMVTHSSVLVWRIPVMREPGGLPFCEVAQNRTQLK